MKTARTLLFAAFAVLALTACSEKKQTNDIIATKPVVKPQTASPVKMQNYNYENDVDWLGQSYKVIIKRHVDTSLPVIDDGAGGKYYDNVIEVCVKRPDGTDFFKKTFSKSDFSNNVNEGYLEKSALLGIVLESSSGDNLCFAASVGSPDVLSDEYVPLVLTLSRTGSLNIAKDTRLDSAEEEESV